jgi:uncharacterized protein (DUF1800 family)
MPSRRLRPLACLLLVPTLAAAAPPPPRAPHYDPQRRLAGHLLRRTGFGPTDREVDAVLAKGFAAYVDEQLDPDRIDDSAAAALYEPVLARFNAATYEYQWYVRMRYSRRQLLEKATVFWHIHFATSAMISFGGQRMHIQEATLRRDAFGGFAQMLADVTRDGAMLSWLNNDRNDGNARDESGVRIPPNENYARELLQLFSMGPTRLELDGTPVLDADGRPVPNYTEDDVKEIARALTGWATVNRPKVKAKSKFLPELHDSGPKTIFGHALAGRSGADGAREVEDVVGLIMQHPSTAPFVARALVLDFATETPTRDYVRRVATVFRDTNGDLKATLRAVLLDPEFVGDAVVRTQFKTPIEHVLNLCRTLDVEGAPVRRFGGEMTFYSQRTGQQIYYPPTVFSFYPPGQKIALVSTYFGLKRDEVAAEIMFNVSGFMTGVFDPDAFVRRRNARTPEQVVDALADAMLRDDLAPGVRDEVLAYMGGEVSPTKVRGAAWLLACSPDFQVN